MRRAITSENISKIPKSQWVSACWDASLYCGLPVAVWRLPQQRVVQGAVSFRKELEAVYPELETLEAGFLIAPFENDNHAFYLKADFVFHSENQPNLLEEFRRMHEGREFFSALSEGKKLDPSQIALPTNQLSSTQEADFKRWVKEGKEAIEQGLFQKVVLSRALSEPLPEDFAPYSFFLSLCEKYPAAFISMVFLPGQGIWIGASPETLVEVKDKKHFTTISLAGTQALAPETDLMDVAWTQKEIEEQALVGRYIINCFKKIRLREYEEIGPKTVAAGHLAHLRSDFTVDMEAQRFPELGTVMLELLHPTSAVCGMPKPAALEFIHQYETHQREFYSGFLGPVNIQNNTHLFVNLRCMKVTHQTVTYFAGAGITSGSKPEKEWQETTMKMAILRKLLSLQ